jgi:putative addiction module component (TIGR02574 family)
MAIDMSLLGIDQLSVGERLQLIEQIWDTLPETVEPNEVPPEHLAELKKRRSIAQSLPRIGKPWREVLDQLGKES